MKTKPYLFFPSRPPLAIAFALPVSRRLASSLPSASSRGLLSISLSMHKSTRRKLKGSSVARPRSSDLGRGDAPATSPAAAASGDITRGCAPPTSAAAALPRPCLRLRSFDLVHGYAPSASPTAASRSHTRGGARPASPAATRRAHRHGTARRRPRRAVPGSGCRYGGAAVPRRAVPRRARTVRLATYTAQLLPAHASRLLACMLRLSSSRFSPLCRSDLQIKEQETRITKLLPQNATDSNMNLATDL